ncbi:MAG TPA: paraquat-inducible protein A [Nevskiaceae bacterium]|nr:paraquat-inducible protein A [Nevskiaceae bacterium]
MSTLVTAADVGLARCGACGATCRREDARRELHCHRCHAPLALRKHASLTRTYALLLAATVLYLPANLLPIMETSKLFEVRQDTILSGILHLWSTGSYYIAIIVFVASMVVPIAKVLVLALLAATASARSTWAQRERATLYRAIEFIGYWSMLDVFVVALLAALVQLGAAAGVQPLPGAVAFLAVVILTMLASMSFDPRLIWDQDDAR